MNGITLKDNRRHSILPWRKFKEREVTVPQDVPDTVKEAYPQANILVEISPKASNALSRYCLQVMIRDYWNLPPRKRGTLDAELRHISPVLSPETKESFDIVRNHGMVGAQLCEDVNLMVETTADEARLLIGLIDLLFEDWYMDRSNRQARCNALRKIAEEAEKTAPTLLTKQAPAQLKKPAAKKAKPRAAAKASSSSAKS